MVDLNLLRECGVTDAKLKSVFTTETPDPKVQKLKDLILSRVIDGRSQNLRDYRTYWAIDCAYDAPFQQREIVLLQAFYARSQSTDAALALANQWGLTEADLFYWDVGTDGQKVRKIKQQHMFRVLVPIVKSYVTIRRAKLFNDRNVYPFLKYEPISFTTEKRILCEVITDVVQRMSSAFGFPAYLDQVILQTLLYGHCLMFVKEPWYCEYQMVAEESYTVTKGDSLKKLADQFNVTTKEIQTLNKRNGGLKVGEKIKIPKRKQCVKEGLRYSTPHPTRSFFDLSEPQNTINTDTGCRYAGEWTIRRYGELDNDPEIWNKDKITWGGSTTDWFGAPQYQAFWQEVYPCTMNLGGLSTVEGSTNRESRSIYYNSQDADAAVFVTSIFMKIVPSQYGLGNYDCAVWFQFLVANDSTVLFCAPVPYTPVLYSGYDADNTRYPQSSMALEITPFQTMLGNILSQIRFTAQQGLWKGMAFDTDQVKQETIDKIENRGTDYGGVIFLPYSSQRATRLGQSPRDMFVPIELAAKNSVELVGEIPLVIDILERMLGMSSSEVGAPASHEQTAEEIRVTNNNTTVRVDFTGTGVDRFQQGWKDQIFLAAQAYMDDEFIAQVKPTPETLLALKDMGFDTVTDKYDEKNPVSIKVKKSALVLDGFSSDRTSNQSISSPAVGAIILQIIQGIASNPLLIQQVGAKPILDFMTQGAILAGAPKDFQLRVDPKAGPEAQAQQMQEHLGKVAEQIQQNVLKQVAEGIKPITDAIKANGEQDAQTVEAVKQLMAGLKQVADQSAKQLQEVGAAVQQTQQGLQQVAQVAGQAKQEADATAQAVSEITNFIKQQVSQNVQPTQPAVAGTVQGG